MKRALALIVVSLTLAVLVVASPAPGAAAQTSLSVRIAANALLVGNGEAVLLKAHVSCPAGWETLEALIYVVQDGNQSPFGALPVRCGEKGAGSIARVSAYPDQLLFHRGAAFASAYVLLHNPATGETMSSGPSRDITIR